MSLPRSRASHTADEYLEFERRSGERHEYLDGQVYLMAGESLAHSQICVNVSGELRALLRGGPCQVLSPNMKVRAGRGDLYAYPDASVVCGEPALHDERGDVLTNPSVVVEVLSPSTEAYDRGEKFFRYRQLETLTDYLLVAQDRPRVDHYTRQPDGRWLLSTASELSASVRLVSLNCELRLDAIYERVAFPADNTPAPDERTEDL
ncbi:MAG TPA: Uma2 family endonuclease [Pyrinomonadaceae bacterium]|nr:Uma2 family endonuclease [Pyrinomonadaceae bacterium]